jgi:hypothetical protein
MVFSFTFAVPKNKGPVRLGVRTSGFHPGNRGSIPLRATKIVNSKMVIGQFGHSL